MATKAKKIARRKRRLERRLDKKRQQRIAAASVPRDLTIVEDGVTVEIDARAGEGGERLPTFSGRAYSGGKLRIKGFRFPVVVEIAGMAIPKQSIPVFRDHDGKREVGHTESIQVVDNEVHYSGVISAENDDARQVIIQAKRKFPWQPSIGARSESIEFIRPGQTRMINGRSFSGPFFHAKSSVLREISFVALGGDDEAETTVVAQQGSEQMNEFEKWIEAQGLDINALSEDALTNLEAAFDALQSSQDTDDSADDADDTDIDADADDDDTDIAAGADDTDPIHDYRRRMVAETRRIQRINDVCRDHADIAARAIDNGWSANRAELEVLRKRRPTGPAVHPSRSNEINAQAIEAALCMTDGIPENEVGEWYGERTMNAALGRSLQGAGLRDVMVHVIHAAGLHAPQGRIDNSFIQTAFRAERNLQASADIEASGSGFATVTLTGILGNVANKAMLRAYNAVNSVVDQIAGSRNVPDFKEVTSYRMTGKGVFEKVGPTGELKLKSLGEESYTNQADTYGALISLTRQMMINDDLGAFLQLPRIIGRMSALNFQEVFWTEFLDNASFFTTGNANYFEGASTDLSISSLTTAEQKFMDQTDSEGKPIMLMPSRLLVPTSLKTVGEQLYNDTTVNETTTANKPKPMGNPHAGKWRVISTPYLNNSSFTGNSSTAWYLLGDPSDVPVIEVAYLRGRRTPVIESSEAAFNTLGMQWRGYFDFGVNKQDHRGGVKSKGAA